jgi:hypothetical protein
LFIKKTVQKCVSPLEGGVHIFTDLNGNQNSNFPTKLWRKLILLRIELVN